MKHRPLLLLILLIFCGGIACQPVSDKIPSHLMSDKSQSKLVIYQMLTRTFGNKNPTNTYYGSIQENGSGKFNDITSEALRGIKELGVTHIWYTGIIEHASCTDYSAFGITPDHPQIVKGRAGSPYAIKDYYDVAPDLAENVTQRMEEFEALIARTHQADLKLIIDYVPNHVARSYASDKKPSRVVDFGQHDDKTVSFDPSNNFYYLPGTTFSPPVQKTPWLATDPYATTNFTFQETPAKVTGNDSFTARPAPSDWYETVKLNYGVDIQRGGTKHFTPTPDTWLKMRDIILYWISKGIDGFRCDMAQMVPIEFWKWIIPQARKANPDILFIAEIYDPSLYTDFIMTAEFDLLYDKVQLYDTLRKIVSTETGADQIEPIYKSLRNINNHLLHFLENHDEQRIASPFFAADPWKGMTAMVVSALIDQGATMIYAGQEVGETGQGREGFSGDDGRTTLFDYWAMPEHQKWMNGGKFDGGLLSDDQKRLRQTYATILNFSTDHPAIVHGDHVPITYHSPDTGSTSSITSQVYAFLRAFEKKHVLVAVNFSSDTTKIKIKCPQRNKKITYFDPQLYAYVGTDIISGQTIYLNFQLEAELVLLPHEFYIIPIVETTL